MPLGENPAQPGSHPVPVARTFNANKKAVFLLELARTGSVRGAAARTGITPKTVYEHANKDVSFGDAIERARGDWEQANLDAIQAAASTGKVIERRNGTTTKEPGDWHASAWLLEHSPTTRERYAGVLKSKVEVSGDPDGAPIQVENHHTVDIGPGTMDRLQTVIMVLAKAGKIRLPDPGEIIDGEATDVTPDGG